MFIKHNLQQNAVVSLERKNKRVYDQYKGFIIDKVPAISYKDIHTQLSLYMRAVQEVLETILYQINDSGKKMFGFLAQS